MATKNRYQFKAGSPIGNFGVSAEDAGRTIEAIAARNGGQVQPGMLVEVARASAHPLHPYFQWDDALAAESHRINQARALIRAVLILPTDNTTRTVRAFVSVVHGQGYEPIAQVMSDHEKRGMLISRALGELDQMRVRYEELAELAEVWEAAERVSTSIRKPKTKSTRARS